MFCNIQEILEYKNAIKELPKNLGKKLIEMVMEDRELDAFEWDLIYLMFLEENYDELIEIEYLEEVV